MECSRQELWSGLPFHSPGDLPNPGVELGPPALQADSLLGEPPGKHPSMYRTAPTTENYLAPGVSSAAIKKS